MMFLWNKKAIIIFASQIKTFHGPHLARGPYVVHACKYSMNVFSLSTWSWIRERSEFLDFIQIVSSSMALVLTPQPPVIDMGLFIRLILLMFFAKKTFKKVKLCSFAKWRTVVHFYSNQKLFRFFFHGWNWCFTEQILIPIVNSKTKNSKRYSRHKINST